MIVFDQRKPPITAYSNTQLNSYSIIPDRRQPNLPWETTGTNIDSRTNSHLGFGLWTPGTQKVSLSRTRNNPRSLSIRTVKEEPRNKQD